MSPPATSPIADRQLPVFTPPMTRALAAVVLLLVANTFMTFAWYFHLTKKGWPLLLAIGISWMIALPEYILQVPANRLGHTNFGGPFTATQLKIIQEAITLTVFTVFTLYIASPTVQLAYSRPMLLYLVCPILLYWFCRALMMAHRRLMDDDPIVFALKDRNSLLAGLLILLIFLVAI